MSVLAQATPRTCIAVRFENTYGQIARSTLWAVCSARDKLFTMQRLLGRCSLHCPMNGASAWPPTWRQRAGVQGHDVAANSCSLAPYLCHQQRAIRYGPHVCLFPVTASVSTRIALAHMAGLCSVSVHPSFAQWLATIMLADVDHITIVSSVCQPFALATTPAPSLYNRPVRTAQTTPSADSPFAKSEVPDH